MPVMQLNRIFFSCVVSGYPCFCVRFLAQVVSIAWFNNALPMDQGREREKTSRRGAYTYAAQSKAQYISAFTTRVLQSTYVSMWREREPEPEFSNFSGPQTSIPQNWQIGFGNPLSSCFTRTTIYAGRIDSLEIFALFKSLKIWALENFICLLRHTFTHS